MTRGIKRKVSLRGSLDWKQKHLGSAKERMLASWIGGGRLCAMFGGNS